MRILAAVVFAAVISAGAGLGARPTPAAAADPDPLAWLADERVLFVGNSLLENAQAPLTERLNALGVDHHIEAWPGSSLADDFWVGWTWQAKADELVASFQPTVVVVEQCCNYWPPYAPDGAKPVPGTPEMRTYWEGLARDFAQRLTAGGAQLWWVVTPPLASAAQTLSVVDPINDTTFAQVHTPTQGLTPPNLIRWDLALTGGTGVYTDTLVVDGAPTTIRSDGIHLTEAGGRVAADAILQAFAGQSPPTPWGPFEALDRIDRFALQELYGQQPYDTVAVAAIALPSRYAPGRPWLEHLRVLFDSVRWAGTARPIGRLYRAAFGRVPEGPGLRWWTHEVAGPRRTLLGAARQFAASPEFQQRYGSLDDGELVTQLYRNVLQRDPDAEGLAYWRVVLASGTPRSRVMLAFSESGENKVRSQAQVEHVVAQVGLLGDLLLPVPAWGGPPEDPAQVFQQVVATPQFTDRAAAYLPRP